jgi:hypothetical protein
VEQSHAGHGQRDDINDNGVVTVVPGSGELAECDASVQRQLAELAVRDDWRAPVPMVVADVALRPLPEPLSAVVRSRTIAGYAPEGFTYPRSGGWVSVVAPTGAAAAGAAVVGGLLASVATVVVAAAIGVAGSIGAAAAIRRDPLRLDARQRSIIAASKAWHSQMPWVTVLDRRPQRDLVRVAIAAVQRIVASRAWRDGIYDSGSAQPDLGAELSEIDRQAYEIGATTHHLMQTGIHDLPLSKALTEAWNALVARVGGLEYYAYRLEVLDAQTSASSLSVRNQRLTESVAALIERSVLDEFALERMRGLAVGVIGAQDIQGITNVATSPANYS